MMLWKLALVWLAGWLATATVLMVFDIVMLGIRDRADVDDFDFGWFVALGIFWPLVVVLVPLWLLAEALFGLVKAVARLVVRR